MIATGQMGRFEQKGYTMRTILLSILLILLAGTTRAVNLDTLNVKTDTVLAVKGSISNAIVAVPAISPSGKIFLWAAGKKMYSTSISATDKISAPQKLPIGSGLLMFVPMGAYNGRWNASFSADDSMVVYPSGEKLISLRLVDGQNTTLGTRK